VAAANGSCSWVQRSSWDGPCQVSSSWDQAAGTGAVPAHPARFVKSLAAGSSWVAAVKLQLYGRVKELTSSCEAAIYLYLYFPFYYTILFDFCQ
jgi:hypothetical protein